MTAEQQNWTPIVAIEPERADDAHAHLLKQFQMRPPSQRHFYNRASKRRLW
jgi:hypothetical protein